MEIPSVQYLESLKYSDLQKLAKTAGLKANLKADKLLKALKAHFHLESSDENASMDSEENADFTDLDELNSSQEKKELVSSSYVNQRRGKGRKAVNAKTSPKVELNTIHAEKDVIQTTEREHQLEKNQTEENEEKTVCPESERKPEKRCRVEEKQTPTKTVEKSKKRKLQDKNATGALSAGKIPVYVGRLPKPGSKPSTPNFKKLHEAHFKKMESIDKYMERKLKRLDAVSTSIQEVKMLAKKSNLLKLSDKTPVSNSKKPIKSKLSLLSPTVKMDGVSPRTPLRQRRSACVQTANRSILVDKSVFNPSVFSSSKMNVRFSETTEDNEHKRSLMKTPARKSSCLLPVTPVSESRQSMPSIKKSDLVTSTERKNQPATTPFKFSAQSSQTPSTNKKTKFDLQASLSRPLGYQPHKGKLKPWTDGKENQSSLKCNASLLKANFKQPQLQTREDRRKQHEHERKGKRDQTLRTRRGVAIPVLNFRDLPRDMEGQTKQSSWYKVASGGPKWEDISMDFIVDLPLSEQHNTIYVVVDRLTKMACFIPTRKPTHSGSDSFTVYEGSLSSALLTHHITSH
ncbi:nucleolar and spindle-associated protein 1 [Rhinophrynus dorsalis]